MIYGDYAWFQVASWAPPNGHGANEGDTLEKLSLLLSKMRERYCLHHHPSTFDPDQSFI